MKKQNLINIIKEEIRLILTEFNLDKDSRFVISAEKKMKTLSLTNAIKLLYKLTSSNKISEPEFDKLSKELVSRIHRVGYKENYNKEMHNLIKEQVVLLLEMSIRQLKDKILQVLALDIVKQYQKDEFTYEGVPIDIFSNNGITLFYLQQYQNSKDIITYDLGIEIDKMKKTVNIFLQKDDIFK